MKPAFTTIVPQPNQVTKRSAKDVDVGRGMEGRGEGGKTRAEEITS